MGNVLRLTVNDCSGSIVVNMFGRLSWEGYMGEILKHKGQYVKIHAMPRISREGELQLFGENVDAVKDCNEVSSHLAQCMKEDAKLRN